MRKTQGHQPNAKRRKNLKLPAANKTLLHPPFLPSSPPLSSPPPLPLLFRSSIPQNSTRDISSLLPDTLSLNPNHSPFLHASGSNIGRIREVDGKSPGVCSTEDMCAAGRIRGRVCDEGEEGGVWGGEGEGGKGKKINSARREGNVGTKPTWEKQRFLHPPTPQLIPSPSTSRFFQTIP